MDYVYHTFSSLSKLQFQFVKIIPQQYFVVSFDLGDQAITAALMA